MGARHEYKHNINYSDYLMLRSRLKALIHTDSNAGADGSYRIRSLYFDSPGDKALKDKLGGVDKREKFRLRRYIGHDLIKLEKKSKQKGLCYKQSVSLSADETSAVLSGDYAFMNDPDRELLYEFYSKIRSQNLKPKTIVEYTREAFVYSAGNVRVTFDYGLHTGVFCRDFLCDTAPLVPAGDSAILMEIKYDQFIPDFLINATGLNARSASANSKYALCRVYG
jgi:hypothetical protein